MYGTAAPGAERLNPGVFIGLRPSFSAACVTSDHSEKRVFMEEKNYFELVRDETKTVPCLVTL